MLKYLLLFAASICGTGGTAFLKQSDGLTRLGPALGSVAACGLFWYSPGMVPKPMSGGIASAIWPGAGMVLIGLIGCFVFRQALDFPALHGMGLIMSGVAVINLFAPSLSH